MNFDLKSLSQPLSNQIILDGKRYLYFSGTAYLGIPNHQEFLAYVIEGISRYGLNNGTSRSNNIQLGIYDEAENYAAKMFNASASLITSSGYLAAQMVVQTFATHGNILYAPASHPALWNVNPPEVNEILFTNWSEEVLQQINSSSVRNWVLISNSMNNLFPEIYDFDFLKRIDPTKEIILIVDDSHGIGINHAGLGAFDTLPKQENITNIVVASMAKALGVDAGIVLSSAPVVEKLKKSNVFIGASPPSAAALFAFIQAESIYASERLKLEKNVAKLKSLKFKNWKYTASFPVFLLEDPGIASRLLTHKILISSFPYPDQNSFPINRIVLSSWHSDEDIESLALAL
ncbi:aminotransferase class I/II-fold pyridoxal phosphate-dependent enzyme [Pedobacter sp. AW1-32]|uniref:aminotransferase class I/II-fold pyridoxal phosphate-dependent enzyme n=1 Tax=Pedobacter sp. AW1-32 TaxID=3383026 RepID=UPI003FEF3DEC